MSSIEVLKKENDRLLRELTDACLQIVNVQSVCRKMHTKAEILEAALVFHLTQDGVCASLEAAKKMVVDTISEGLAERAKEALPSDEEAFDD